MRTHPSLFGVLAALILLPASLGASVDIDSNTFGGLSARSIGPATMSGRIAAIDAVPADPLTIYVGAASGGVWKSTDAGTTFQPVFDDHPQSIGAIRIDGSNPDVVWVGTGESWVRNSVSVGRGVYKTTDGGDSWQAMGLADSERIGAIRIDPRDGDTVYVCATGHLWDDHEERGVFKTTDGGANWEKILYVDAATGCADLDVDPQDPSVLYAAMWQFRRWPYFFNSGGPGSGLYRSTDGGAGWKRLDNGLPRGELGRIAVAVAPSRPNVVYATVESEKTALYRSENLGESWTEVNSSTNVQMRPFYFSEMVVDPSDYRRIYKPGFTLAVSTDGGESFNAMIRGGIDFRVHPDHHALWINPENPHEVLLGSDGGLYMSNDRTNSWRFIGTLPISQFYHVAHDLEWPYNVYGGLQDNGTWMGPSRRLGGIRNRDWTTIGTGDGFWALPDPSDPNTVYVEYQGGELYRLYRELRELKGIKPYPRPGEPKLRFNWDAPIHLSPADPQTVYFGSQFVHRSRDRGESWETISPDLTTNDPAKQRQRESGGLTIDNSTAENHCTVYAIAESPANPSVIWAGTDDGNLQRTRDGGTGWENVAANVPDLPPSTWVSSIAASPFDEAAALVTFDGHHTGDMNSYLYRTSDYGASWQSLVSEEIEGWAHVVRQDPVKEEIVYLGTEFGLYISVDGGEQWARFKGNLPQVAVHDLVVHPTEHDLIIATHGRGIYIIDDLTPLRALTQEILDSDVALLPSRPATMVTTSQLGESSAGHEYVADNPPEAATITYYLKKRHLFGDLRVEIYDLEGKRITSIPGGKRRGLNRVEWPMRFKPPKMPPATNLVMAFFGPRVAEGTYEVRLIKGKKTLEGEVQLIADPRSPHSAEDRSVQQETAIALYDRLRDLSYLSDVVTGLRDAGREHAEKLGKKDARRLAAFAEDLEQIRKTMVSTSPAGWLSGDVQLRERLGNLYADVTNYDGRPSASQLERLEILIGEFEAIEQRIDAFGERELPGINALLRKRGAEEIRRLSREDWEAKEGL
ncbi:MAG: glycosyl hydrolase [bacterium]|nr:glycosyl hydrolase [bacterium]